MRPAAAWRGRLGAGLLLALTTGPVAAATYHVDAANGDDLSSGLSWTDAFATVPVALAAARRDVSTPAPSVRVAAGTYSVSNVVVDFPVVLLGGWPPGGGRRDRAVQLSTLDASGGQHALRFENAAAGSVLDGFTVRGATDAGLVVLSDVLVQNAVLSDNAGLGARLSAGRIRHSEARRNGAGGVIARGSDCDGIVEVAEVLVEDNTSLGMLVDDAGCGQLDSLSSPVVVRDVRVRRTAAGPGGATGLEVGCCPRVFNVEVSDTAGIGVRLNSRIWTPPPWPPPGTPLSHVTITGSSGAAVSAGGVGDLRLSHSILWANSGGDLLGSPSTIDVTYTLAEGPLPGAGNMSGTDPMFVAGLAGATYLSQLASGQGGESPAVDAGAVTSAGAGMATRTTRTDGTRDAALVDLGFHYRPADASVLRGVSPGALSVHRAGVGLPFVDAGAAAAGAPALFFFEVDLDDILLVRRQGDDVVLLLQHQAYD